MTWDGAHQGPAARRKGTTRVPHTNISSPPTGAHVSPNPRRVPPTPPSVPPPRLFTLHGTTPPSTSRGGPAQVSGHATHHNGRGPWSGGARDTRRNHGGARAPRGSGGVIADPSDVLERPYTVGGGGVPPLTPPTSLPFDPHPPPPLPMFEADSQNFASAPSVKRGFTLQNFSALLRRGP